MVIEIAPDAGGGFSVTMRTRCWSSWAGVGKRKKNGEIVSVLASGPRSAAELLAAKLRQEYGCEVVEIP